MFVTLMTQEGCHTISLPASRNGQYWLRAAYHPENEKLLSIEAADGNWCVLSTDTAAVLDADSAVIPSCVLTEQSFHKIALAALNQYAYLYTEPDTPDRAAFTKYRLANGADTLKIGKASDCQIRCSNPMISGSHAVLRRENGSFSIADTNSTNGTFVNHLRIKEQKLSAGDVISVMGMKIILGTDFIALNNPDQSVTPDPRALLPYQAPAPENLPEKTDVLRTFSRSPQFRTPVVPCEIQVEMPPQKQSPDEMPLYLTLGPSLTMGLASMTTALFAVNHAVGQGNVAAAIPSIVMSCSMLCGSVLWPLMARRQHKKERDAREQKRLEIYRSYIDGQAQILDQSLFAQSKALNTNYISVRACIERIVNSDRQLWERSAYDDEFLRLRLGTSDLPMIGEVQIPQEKISLIDDPLIGEMKRLLAKPRVLTDVPVTLSLYTNDVIGINGSRAARNQLLRNLMIQIVTLYGYDYVKLVLLLSEEDAGEFDMFRTLPHLWDNDRRLRYFGVNDNEIKEISIALEAEYDAALFASRDKSAPQRTPYYVVVATDPKLTVSAGILRKVLEGQQNLGFSLIFSAEELREIPKECSRVIYADTADAYILEKENLQEKTLFFNMEQDAGQYPLADVCAILSNLRLNTAGTAGTIPDRVDFLSMFDVRKIDHLNIMERWKNHDPTMSLEAPVGRDAHGNLFLLDLHQNIHGPHGLVAGMTGSGKSEFIITYILSMAVNYHPHEVAFVLIDYKGGGMAKTFEHLPHTVGIITNLDGAGVNRSLVSIRSELARRQEAFLALSAKIGESNIDIYKYQKLYRSGVAEHPMPHLFIISDEFAELKQQRPEFMEQLVSIARIGRSLGVHMILATQKPDGVVDDQIWSNSKFKVCLKVQTKDDSQRMLNRPDAASLVQTGRFYLQVGYNELFELGQSAWAGAPYIEQADAQANASAQISVIDNIGRTVISREVRPSGETEKPQYKKQVDAITAFISRIAAEEQISVPKLWQDPVDPEMQYETLLQTYGHPAEPFVLDPVVGELDDPKNQSRLLMTAPLTKEGNLIVYGAVGSGKAMFLTTLIYSLLREHSAAELNLYIMDFDAETMTAFADAPQVGGVVLIDETEKIDKLLQMLSREIQQRRKRYVDAGGDHAAYNRIADEKDPAIVLVINNITAFEEACEDKMNTLIRIARNGSKYGVFTVISRTGSFGARYKLVSCFPQKLILQSSDEAEYSNVVGKTEGMVPSDYIGRGMVRTADGILEFQTAHVTAPQSNPTDAMQQFSRQLAAAHPASQPRARAIPVLPEHVTTAVLLERFRPEAGSLRVPVGLYESSTAPCILDLSRSFIRLTASASGTHADYAANLIACLTDANQISCMVFDPRAQYSAFRQKTAYAVSAEELEAQTVQLYQLTLDRNNRYVDAVKAGETPPQSEPLVIVLDSLSEIFGRLSADGKEKLESVLEFGKPEYQLTVLIFDRGAALSDYNTADWYRRQVTERDAVWIGSGLNRCYRIQCSNVQKDAIPDDFAFVIANSKAELMKIPVQDPEQERGAE
ncbi:MAG: type VII secretion protein EssC [Oscillospiraceae bacterium]|nr:type VII secretion protein EssC [Oscillospiraceae bacterium]